MKETDDYYKRSRKSRKKTNPYIIRVTFKVTPIILEQNHPFTRVSLPIAPFRVIYNIICYMVDRVELW